MGIIKRCCTFGTMLAFSFSMFAEDIVISGDIWCPVNCEPNAKDMGYMVEIAKIALEDKDTKVIYNPMAWKRAITECADGNVNATIGGYVEDTPHFIFPSEEEGLIGMKFYVNNDSTWRYHDLTSLDKISLGAIQDYSYLEAIDAYILKMKDQNTLDSDPKNPKKRVQLTAGNGALLANMEKLKLRRIDALIESDVVFNYNAKGQHEKNFKEAGAASPAGKAYLAFSPAPRLKEKSERYAKAISNTIIKMRKDGSLAKLLMKYGLKDWKN